MQRILKFWKAVSYLIQKPALFNAILKDTEMLQRNFKKKYPHVQFQELDVFNWHEAKELTVKPFAFLSGSSMLTDFAFLQLLCKKFNVETYFEIGTWRGESAANAASFVKQVYTLNLPDEHLYALGLSEAYINSHRFFSKDIDNIRHLYGDSAKFDFKPYEKQCDLIFIDGDHSAAAVFRDTLTAVSLRKSSDSIIVWHDAKSDAEYPRYEVLLGIYNALPKEMHQNLFLVKHTLCAVYLPQIQQSELLQLNALPNKYFNVTLTTNKLN